MASRVFHLNGLNLDQSTSGAYYALIVWGTGLVRNTGAQPISGHKTYYDLASFLSGVNIGGDLTLTGQFVGDFVPKTDNFYDLGSLSKEWKNGYFDGQLRTDTFLVDENAYVTTGLYVGGNAVLSGDLILGGNSTTSGNSTISGNCDITGNLIITGDFLPKNIANHFLPKTGNAYDLGSSSFEFRNAYFDGTVQTDSLLVDESVIIASNLSVGGAATISGNLSTIGSSTAASYNSAGRATVGSLTITGSGIPASTGSAGLFGQIVLGSGYLYACTGTNMWARVSLSAW